MGDMADDFSALREHNKQRRAENCKTGTEQIAELVLQGFNVRELTPYHFRINSRIDLYPTTRRWHDLKDGARGGWGQETALQIVSRRMKVPDAD